MTLEFLGPVRVGGGAVVALSGANPFAGIVWRLAAGTGVLTPTAPRADAAGLASARFEAQGLATETVRVEADVYG